MAKFKLTGKEVSNELLEVLDRLSAGNYVPIEDIENTSEIKLARSCINNSISTNRLSGREDLKIHILDELQKMGSAVIDENGKVQYNGNVSKEAHLDIVIGLPGSGKSSALVDVISQEFHSRIIDNDEAKKLIPEYNNGWGAGVVHEESQDISFMQLQKALQKKENIILPKVGSDPVKLGRIIDLAHEQGYEVNLHYVELDRERALGRMLTRFIEVGRFLDPKLIDKYVNPWDGNKIERCYEAIKEGGKVDGYSKWNNDVKWGEKPILIEAACNGEFIRNAGYGRRDGCSSVAGHDRQQGIMGRTQRKGNVETDWTDPGESGNGNEEKRQPSIIRKLDKYKEVAAKQSMHPQQHDGRKPQNNKESQREL